MPVRTPAWQAWTPPLRCGALFAATAARRRWRGWWSGRRAVGCAGPGAGSSGSAGILALAGALRAAAGAYRSGGSAAGAGTAGPLIDYLSSGILNGHPHLAGDVTAILGQRHQGQIGQDLDGFAGMQSDDPRSDKEVPDIHQAFIDRHEGGAVEILHIDIEDGAAHRNQRGGRSDIIRIRNPGQMLDVDFDLAHPDVQEVGDTEGFAERDFGIWEDLKRAAVRHLELGVPIEAGFDHLLLFDDTAELNGEAVSSTIPRRGNIARFKQHHRAGADGVRGEYSLRAQRVQRHHERAPQPHRVHGPRERNSPQHSRRLDTV